MADWCDLLVESFDMPVPDDAGQSAFLEKVRLKAAASMKAQVLAAKVAGNDTDLGSGSGKGKTKEKRKQQDDTPASSKKFKSTSSVTCPHCGKTANPDSHTPANCKSLCILVGCTRTDAGHKTK